MPVRVGLTTEEKARRRLTLGSSEIASVCGINPYATSHSVWSAKCLGTETEENEAMRLGNLLEPTIFSIYSDRYSVELTKGAYLLGPEPWMSCTPDAYRVAGGLVEAKLVGLRSIFQWGPGNTDERESDAVPLHYMCQAQWQMVCTGEPFCDVAALLGTEFRTYRIRSNVDVQHKLVNRGRAFWEHYVLTKTPPPVDGSEDCRELLKTLYPRSGAEPVQADERLEQLAAALRQAREAVDQATEAKRLQENLFKAELKDARGAFGDGWRVRYAEQRDGKRPFVFENQEDKSGKAA